MIINTLSQSQYKITLFVQDIDSGILLDLADMRLVESITWQTSRNASQPGTLEVMLKENITAEGIVITEGSRIRFGVNGTDYFFGIIEVIELSQHGGHSAVYVLRAVDHLHFLQSNETAYRAVGMTASGFFTHVMTEHNARVRSLGSEGFNFAVQEPSFASLESHLFLGETVYSMIMDSMSLAHIAEPRQYMIRDELGTIAWRELQALRTPYVLGDESFGESFTYNVNINESSYNIIKVIRDNDEIGFREVWQRHDSNNVRRWWPRQLTVEAQEHMTEAEISDMLNLHLQGFNRPQRRLRLTALGINGLQAGDGVQIRLSRGKIDHYMSLSSVTHVYHANTHKMDLELFFVR